MATEKKNLAPPLEKPQFREEPSALIACFPDRANQLEIRGFNDSALDLIYDSVDELLRGGQFASCDSVLNETNTDDYSANILLAILTATAPARSKLGARRSFFLRTRRTLKRRKEFERGVLDGLE